MTTMQRLGVLIIAFGVAKLVAWAIMEWRKKK